MRRREFISFIGWAAAWPLAANAQQALRRIGVLMQYLESDAEGQASVTALRKGLEDLGWTEGHNVHFEIRWVAADPDKARRFARELVAWTPDVIVQSSNMITTILQQETRTIPVVFVLVGDPIGSGYVASMASPGGNLTGFPVLEPAIGGKWTDMLVEIAPRISRIGFIMQPETPANIGLLHAAETAMPSMIKLTPLGVHDAPEIERAIIAFAAEPGGGLIVAPHAVTFANRNLIVELAARYRLPAVYSFRIFATSGGLISYGTNPIEVFRRSASYVDRVLKGAKPADLPAQFPTKYELVINLKTAKALGLTIPPSLLTRADEVIE
jgi:putative ABC transport system substrate-binding protein